MRWGIHNGLYDVAYIQTTSNDNDQKYFATPGLWVRPTVKCSTQLLVWSSFSSWCRMATNVFKQPDPVMSTMAPSRSVTTLSYPSTLLTVAHSSGPGSSAKPVQPFADLGWSKEALFGLLAVLFAVLVPLIGLLFRYLIGRRHNKARLRRWNQGKYYCLRSPRKPYLTGTRTCISHHTTRLKTGEAVEIEGEPK